MNFNNLTGSLPKTFGLMQSLEALDVGGNQLTGPLPPSIVTIPFLSELNVYVNSLTGSIPNEINQLQFLRFLELDRNSFTGTVPNAIGDMMYLEEIYLAENALNGSIPGSITDLPLLTYFQINRNQFNGHIPEEIGNCTYLSTFVVDSNRISGTIPDSIFDIHLLTELLLNDNKLHGPLSDRVGELVMLTELMLGDNHFSGTLPQTIENLSRLKVFSLALSNISGVIPENIGNLQDITYFELCRTNIYGTIPASIGQLQNCTYLNMYENKLSGPIPPEIGQMHALQWLNIYQNDLTGTVPEEIYFLPILFGLTIYNNKLSGTISESIGNLSRLESVEMQTNNFTGTFPASLCNVFPLANVILFGNQLTGTLPKEIRKLANLQVLYLADNYFTGSIPQELDELNRIDKLDLSSNFFTGTVSANYFSMLLMEVLSLSNNMLNGTIPTDISEEHVMVSLDLNNNYLTGSIPEQLGRLQKLTNLDLSYNELTGTLSPQMLGNLTEMFGYGFNDNFLNGTLPQEIGSSLRLNDIYANNNLFSGSIPEFICNLGNLSQLFLGYNLLTGSIPAQVGRISNLSYVALQNNFLTGSMPASITRLGRIVGLDVSYNRMTGALPRDFGSMALTEYLALSYNALTGSLPPTMSNMSRLTVLLLNNNGFAGTTNGLFNVSQTSLTTIDLSNNQLTGSLPTEPFEISTLQTFAAVSNCFSGSLPMDVCDSEGLEVLALDGIAAASSCQVKFFSSIDVDTYHLKNRIKGGIPACYFEIPTLRTLHLSGNGLTGSLSDSVTISTSLTDLSVANNILTGTVPQQFQEAPWSNFDLSYNKLTGIISAANWHLQATNSSSLSLEVNRLSGVIPAYMKDVQDISILDGNMFTCSIDKSSLPQHDSDYKVYDCGSNAFNMSIFVWIAILALVIIAFVAWMLRSRGKSTENDSEDPSCVAWNMRKYIPVIHGYSSHDNIKVFLDSMHFVRMYVAPYLVVLAVVLCVVYGALTAVYHTYTYEYAWTLSIAHLSGIVPGVVGIVLLALIITANLAMIRSLFRFTDEDGRPSLRSTMTLSRPTEDSTKVLQAEDRSERVKQGAILMLITVANVSITVTVNAIYVYVSINYGQGTSTFAQLLIALYKLLWNRVVVPRTLAYFRNNAEGEVLFSENFVLLFLFINELFNNIVAPCLATAAISSDCFYNMFVTPPSVSSSYSFEVCGTISIINSTCTSLTTVTSNTSYTPPFNYSYQCSSTLVTNYAAVYVYLFIFATFGKHLLYQICFTVQKHSTSEATKAFCGNIIREIRTPDSVNTSLHSSDSRNFFDKAKFLLTIYSHLTVLFTFGVVFPPLCFVITLSLLSHLTFTEIALGRYLSIAKVLQVEELHALYINRCMKRLLQSAPRTLALIVYFSALFYSWFIFDIVGDARGWVLALVCMLIMMVTPYLAEAAIYCAHRFLGDHNRQNSNTLEDALLDSTKVIGRSSDLRTSLTFRDVETPAPGTAVVMKNSAKERKEGGHTAAAGGNKSPLLRNQVVEL